MTTINQGVFAIGQWFVLTKQNAEKVAEELAAMLKEKHFAILTHSISYPSRPLTLTTSQTLKSNGKKPIRVEEVNNLTKIVVATSLETFELITKLSESIPDYERINTHFLFTANQVKISFQDLKGEKKYLFFAPENHGAKEG